MYANSTQLLFWILLFQLPFIIVHNELSAHFRQFLDNKYGSGVGDRMARADMGKLIGGSFGGMNNGGDPIVNEPVIFIHGVTLRAGIFMAHRKYFLDRGYSDSELYATTYSDGGQTPFYKNELTCENVKHIRQFIIAVNEYTNKTVDIIAYSMGVAISRKAILGGRCVDTGENLGFQLTKLIDTYVSVGGVAYGMEGSRCPETQPACNEVNGMVCTSAYMHNVNKPNQRYEGAHSYGIYSREDFIVGQECCGHQCSELNNAEKNIVAHNDHLTMLIGTLPTQYFLITNHTEN